MRSWALTRCRAVRLQDDDEPEGGDEPEDAPEEVSGAGTAFWNAGLPCGVHSTVVGSLCAHLLTRHSQPVPPRHPAGGRGGG